MTEALSALSSFFGKHRWIKSTLFLSLFFGLAIRLICIPFIYDYDVYHWGVIIQNINSGNGLYELFGYYYTPVWGYVMGFIDFFANTFLSVDEFGSHVSGLLGIEDLNYRFHIAVITTPEFNALMKIPLILCDLLVGYLIYRIVFEWTGKKEKASYAFALWFLCPIVMYMSGVQAMFDTFSALFFLLSVLLALRRHYFFSGFMIALSVFLKLFPAVTAFVFIGLIVARGKTEGDTAKNTAVAVFGATACFVLVFLPNILNGTLSDSLTFISDRAGSYSFTPATMISLAGIVLTLVMMCYTGCKMFKAEENLDSNFVKNLLLVLAVAMMMNMGPQYFIVLIPLLVIFICTQDRSYAICWVLIGFGPFISAFALNNFSLLSSPSVYLGWASFETVVNGLSWMENICFGISYRVYADVAGSLLTMSGIMLFYLFCFENGIAKKWPNLGHFIEKCRTFSFGGVKQ